MAKKYNEELKKQVVHDYLKVVWYKKVDSLFSRIS